MRKLLWILIILFFPIFSKAAYHTSGYISVKYLSGYTYQVTIVDYTVGNIVDTGACGTNDTDTIRIYWGDGQSTLLTRSNGKGDSVCECRKANLYIGTHTYTGYGNYTIWYGAVSRIPNIQNMINSGNQQILITHTLIISPLTRNTNSPVIANPSICTYGCTSNCYHFNLGATTSGGDSLSYALGNCSGAGYYIPSNAAINPVTGELSWCNPTGQGLWNFAIFIVTHHSVTIDSTPLNVPVDTEEVELEVEIDPTCITGINEITNKTEYTIYPNPSNGQFTLEASGVSSKAVVEIYNVLGEKVFAQTIRQDQATTRLNIQDDPSGIYLYRIITDSGVLVSKGKFIIQK